MKEYIHTKLVDTCHMESSVFHISEITINILCQLNDIDLSNACKTNKTLKRVCENDYFWRLRIQHVFGGGI